MYQGISPCAWIRRSCTTWTIVQGRCYGKPSATRQRPPEAPDRLNGDLHWHQPISVLPAACSHNQPHRAAELTTLIQYKHLLQAPLLQALVLKSQIQGTLVLVSLTNDWANQCVVDYALLQTKEHHNNKDPSLAQQVEAQWKEFIAEFNQRPTVMPTTSNKSCSRSQDVPFLK